MGITAPQLNRTTGPLHPDVGILAMVPDRWKAAWQPRHQIVSRLARHFHVAWVSPADKWRRAFSGGGWRTRPESNPAFSDLLIYESNTGWPRVERPKSLEAWLFARRVRAARGALARRGCRSIALAVWLPDYARAIGVAPFDLTCYFIDDEYSWSETEHDVPPRELELIGNVDQVFVHSPALMEKKGGINPYTSFAPNGVDFAAYAARLPEPRDLAGVPRPRIGYAGILKTELDWSLLTHLADRHPDWSFVFVGPKRSSQADALARVSRDVFARTNVYWLGPKSVAELPAYQQHFDVAMLPYRSNAYTRYIYPLKLHESLAAGPPVVGTRIRTLEDFTHVIGVAERPDDWSRALSAGLGPDANSAAAREARRTVAQQHDWTALVARIADTVIGRLRTLQQGSGDR